MKQVINKIILAAALAAVVAGCATNNKSAAAKPAQPKYIYLPPETGSRVGRLVRVNPDGTTEQMPSNVGASGADAYKNAQEKAGTNFRTGN